MPSGEETLTIGINAEEIYSIVSDQVNTTLEAYLDNFITDITLIPAENSIQLTITKPNETLVRTLSFNSDSFSIGTDAQGNPQINFTGVMAGALTGDDVYGGFDKDTEKLSKVAIETPKTNADLENLQPGDDVASIQFVNNENEFFAEFRSNDSRTAQIK
jgi:hypothetical protein